MTGRAILRLSPIALLVVVAACGGGGTKTVTVTQTITAPEYGTRIYLLRDGKVAPVAEPAFGLVPAVVANVLNQRPTPAEHAIGLRTAFPGGTDFEVTSRAATAQMVYTLSQKHPSRPVRLGNKTYTRADFEDETPIILVESPLPFAHVTNPLRVTGTANTFEATFDYDLVGADGKVLAHHFVTATSGNGVRGTFDFTARFSVPHEEQGKLVVYEISAKDGSRVHQSEIPLTLEP